MPSRAAGYLSGNRPKQTEGEDILGRRPSIDQVIARQIGRDTPLPSLEVATEDFSTSLGACDTGYSCVYMNTISWAAPKTPLPMETNPRVVFERLFGEPGSVASARRAAAGQPQHSRLRHRVRGTPAGDARTARPVRLGDYLENIREIERRIQRSEQTIARPSRCPTHRSGLPDSSTSTSRCCST